MLLELGQRIEHAPEEDLHLIGRDEDIGGQEGGQIDCERVRGKILVALQGRIVD